MPKSYKITSSAQSEMLTSSLTLSRLGEQLHLPLNVPGPKTTIRRASVPPTVPGFVGYDISHEYTKLMPGRSLETGEEFTKFIAIGPIKAYLNRATSVLLLSGKKADVLDFCRQTEDTSQIKLSTIDIDMGKLQEKLPNVRGVWFRCSKALIRAKGFMGEQLQDTSEFRDAKDEGQISTLSFHFEDVRDGCVHPVQITQDGTVVLQRNYRDVDAEIDFVLQVKRELLDGIYEELDPTKTRPSLVADLPTA